jgi:hypothetical protein
MKIILHIQGHSNHINLLFRKHAFMATIVYLWIKNLKFD